MPCFAFHENIYSTLIPIYCIMSGADNQKEYLMFDAFFNTSYSVTGLTTYIREVIESNDTLQDVRVTGEVSNMRRAASGHWYFTLKDSNAQLKAVMWRSSTEKQTFIP